MSEVRQVAENIDAAIGSYLRRIDRGETVDRDRFIQTHKRLSAELARFFDDLDCVTRHVVTVEFDSPSAAELTQTSTGLHPRRDFVRIDARHLSADVRGEFLEFGDFELIQELGRGGMGIVFKARQRSLDRIVCVKMMLMAELAEANEFRRFRSEAMAIAQLNHPAIVAIHEVGQHNGTPYYVMEYIDGVSLAQSVVDASLPASETAGIVIQIAEAIHLAHRQGIVHRDLKPSNVLVDEQGKIHITDFGLAKHLEAEEDLTVTGQVLGTPAFMSPEQADARHGELGPAADIYAVGAILYALLTGRPPHRAESALETVRQVIQEAPIRPRLLNSAVATDLETICLKCLEKAPAGRYESAAALADDLRRFVAGEPILARPLSRIAQTRRWIDRHPTISLLAAGLLLALVGLAAGLSIYNADLEQVNLALERTVMIKDNALTKSRLSELTAARNLQYISDMQLVEPFAVEGDHRSSIDLLKRNIPATGKTDLRGLEWHVLKQRRWRTGKTYCSISSPIYCAVFAPDGASLAIAGSDAIVRFYDTTDQTLIGSIETEQQEVNGLAFSSSGGLLATTGDDGTIKIWDTDRESERLLIRAHDGPAFNVCFIRADTVLVSAGRDSILKLWNVATGQALESFEGPTDGMDAFAVSPGDRYVWTVSGDRYGRRVDLLSGQFVEPSIRYHRRPTCVALSGDGKLAVTGDLGRHVTVCNCETFITEQIDASHSIQSVAISPNGQFLAAGDRNGSVRVWSIREAERAPSGFAFDPVSGWSAHDGRVYSVVFSPDSNLLLSMGSDGKAMCWNVKWLLAKEESFSWEANNSGSDNGFEFLPHSALLVSANPDTGLEFWNCDSKPPSRHLTLPMEQAVCVGCSPTGGRVAAGGRHGEVTVWDIESRETIFQVTMDQEISQLAFSPDESLLAVVTWQPDSAFRQTQLFRVSDGTALIPEPRKNWRHASFSLDGEQLYVALDEADEVIKWDISEQRVVGTFNHHDTTIQKLGVSPDGKYVVTVSNDRAICLHNVADPSADSAIGTGLQGDILSFAIGPLSKSVVVADSLGVVRVCNLRAARRVVDLVRVFQPGEPEGLALSFDGRFLAMRWNGTFRVFGLLPSTEL